MKKEEKLTVPRGTSIPDHIAIILDGNRRWARARGLHTLQGHKAGFDAGLKVARAARELGVHTVTVWGFSTENWDRSKEEINYLMTLYRKFVSVARKEAQKEDIRVVHLGRKDRFPKKLIEYIAEVEEETRHNKSHVLNVALDYGGRDEILRAVKKVIADGIPAEKIDEKLLASYLDTGDQPYPYPDLFIRTSGEQRTSGFLTWQLAYAEFYWERDHLPDMNGEKLKEAILDYSRRRRRFGGNDKEGHLTFKPEVTAKFELAWWRLRKIPQGTKFTDYALNHLREQYGLSKSLAKEASILLVQAVKESNDDKWEKAGKSLHKFYKLIKEEIQLAFEPKIVASLDIKLMQNESAEGATSRTQLGESEEVTRQYIAEMYRISEFQAAKAAHLRVLATVERGKAEKGEGERHWTLAEEYLQKYYRALKDRVA
jgi:undecaprenyl diphosphate synthase